MAKQLERTVTAKCACGAVEIEAYGKPLAHIACYCDDCQEAARQLQAMTDAPAIMDDDGATRLVLVRDDRYRIAKGDDQVRYHKLRDRSKTHRAYTTCCHSALYIGFESGPHWVSLFATRCKGALPPLEARIQTKFKPEGATVPTDVPAKAFPIGLVLRLVWSKVLMLLGR